MTGVQTCALPIFENLPASAGDTGSSPGLGRSHMPRSGWAREPQLLSLSVWSLCPATGGAAIVRGPRAAMKSGPRLPQLEKALARNKDSERERNSYKIRSGAVMQPGLTISRPTASSCGKWGPLFIAARGPLTIAASLVAEQRLQMLRLSSCGSRAQLLRGM